MARRKSFQELFKRYRRPGDLVFALAFFAFAVFLLFSLPFQTSWVERTALVAQPAFWPAVAVTAMALFSALHLAGAAISDRIPGRRAEVLYWLRSVEYALWFMAYVAIVPWAGYLPGSVLFAGALAWRVGYRSARWMAVSALFAVAVVLIFKSFLQVRIPAGALYRMLPPGELRSFLMIYL